MSFLVPTDTMNALKKGIGAEIREYFPYEGRRNKLVLDRLYLGEKPGMSGDVTKQKRTKLAGRTWSVPVFADMRLISEDGKVLDNAKKVRLANIPQITSRYSFIVEGREHQVDNQWRLKSGVYSRIKENGELEATFNLAAGRGFNVAFDPKRLRFSYNVGTTNVPAYSVMRALGAVDDQLKHAWGPEIYAANVKASKFEADMRRIHKAYTGKVGTAEEGLDVLREQLQDTELRPDTTKSTLGKAFDTVNNQVLVRASQRLLEISRGEAEPDRRDALEYKELLSVDDLLSERIKNSGRKLKEKLSNNIDRKKRVREVVEPGLFNFAINSLFGSEGIAPTPSQTNPLEMVSNQMRTTVMGPGGISDPHKVTMSAKLVDPSHIGFLDPNHTPEGDKTGITLHLALGVQKRGRTPVLEVYNTKTKKVEQIDPATINDSNVAYPDQYTWKKGKPIPGSQNVKVSGKKNFPTEVAPKDVDYILLSSKRLFSITSNMIPFLQNDQGNRVEMAARHLEQAISLKKREVPLVQVSAGGSDPSQSFEKVFGTLVGSHRTAQAGTVTAVTPEEIRIKTAKGTLKVPIYNHYPLNDNASYLNAEPIVKVGDKVTKGQILADTNYTRNGTLALGLNLRVGYLSHKGYTFEDGISISESAAKKMTSSHLRKKSLKMGNEVFVGLNRYRAQFPDRIDKEAAESLTDEGIIKPGTVVEDGSYLIAALRKADPTPEARLQRGIHKSLIRPFKDHSLVWHGARGVVQEVVQRGKETLIFVKTEEPMQVGDKMCYTEDHDVLTREGWVPVGDVGIDAQVASLNPDSGKIEYVPVTETHSYPCTDEPLYVVDTEQVSMAVTLGHKLYAKPRSIKKSSRHELIAARELIGRRYRLQQTGIWTGVADQDSIALPAMEVKAGQGGKGTRTLPAVHFKLDDYLALLGMYLSEGNCQQTSHGDAVVIHQVKEPNRTQMIERLHDAGLRPTVRPDRVILHGKQLRSHFKQFGLAEDKHIPEWVFELPPERLQVLYKWLMWGDGCEKGTAPVYTTISPQLADGVQRLVFHLGWAGRISAGEAREGFIKGRPYHFKKCYRVHIARKRLWPTINHGHSKKQDGQHERVEHYTGTVYCPTLEKNHILYVRREGKCHWSGNSGRHGNKGVITRILPDREMPVDKDGNPLEVVMSARGVAGRINLGQTYETVMGKVAKKLGHPVAVSNFELDPEKRVVKVSAHTRRIKTDEGWKIVQVKAHERDASPSYRDLVDKIAKKNKVSPTEELFDPATGAKLQDDQGRNPLVGHQFFLKLEHQAAKKRTARSAGHGFDYTVNKVPKGGGASGAQSLGELGLYAMLSHGAKHNIREMYTAKSDFGHEDTWTALQAGESLPPPKPTFAYEKFTSYLNTMGLNIDKKGNSLTLMPFTDKQIQAMSNGDLRRPTLTLRAKDLKPEKGGLFDVEITGGVGGKKWSAVKLAEPVPNPLFEKAIQSLLGLKKADFNAIVTGKTGLSKSGELVEPEDADYQGANAISKMLSKIDVKERLKSAEEGLKVARKGELNKLHRQVKILRALKANELDAQVYMLKRIPVLPPQFRPISVLPSGDLNDDDLNRLYKDMSLINTQLQKFSESEVELPDEEKNPLRAGLYDSVKALYGVSGAPKRSNAKGILELITPTKRGFFQGQLMQRKQDLTGRGVIVPEDSLSLDEVGIPRTTARTLYKPFVVRELVRQGFSPLQAGDAVEEQREVAEKALDFVVKDRPVLLKRDPVLHKFGIMAFKPKLVSGDVIQIHPLIIDGYNADFDGDAQLNSVICYMTSNMYNADVAFWSMREVNMSARFREDVGVFDDDGHFAICNLEDFPHGELIGTKDSIDFYRAPEGIRVVAIDEKEGSPILAPVSGWSVHRDNEVEVVTLGSGRQIITDDDERAVYGVDADTLMWCRRRPSESQNQLVPIVDEVSVLSNVAALPLPDSERLLPEAVLDETFGFFLGCLVGDGWVPSTKKGKKQICLASSYPEVAEAWQQSLLSVFSETPTVTVTAGSTTGVLGDGSGAARYVVSEAKLAEWIAPLIGHRAQNKHLPPFFHSAPEAFKRGLLSGLLTSDGSVSWSNAKSKPQFMCAYHSTSIRLVQEVQALLRSLSITSTVTSTKTPKGNSAWILGISSVDYHRVFANNPLRPLPQEKAEIELDFLSGKAPDNTMAYSRYRLVPLPSVLAKALRGIVKAGEHKSLYTTLSKATQRMYISKVQALRVIELVGNRCTHPLYRRWVDIVNTDGVHFERVINIEKTGICETGYDLTVPGYETFMATDGVVLSNTMSLYVPLTNEAKEESYKLFPSRNLYSPATGKLMYTPAQESLIGLNQLSRWGKKTLHKFKTPQDAIEAARKGQIGYTDQISVMMPPAKMKKKAAALLQKQADRKAHWRNLQPGQMGKTPSGAPVSGKTWVKATRTTAGRLLLDSALPKDMRGGALLTDGKYTLDGKSVKKLLTDVSKNHEKDFGEVADAFKDMGFGYGYRVGYSFDLDDIDPKLAEIRDKIFAVADAAAIKLRKTTASGEQQNKKLTQLYSTAAAKVEKDVKAYLAKNPNRLSEMGDAGVKPKWNQVKQMLIGPLQLKWTDGKVIPSPIRKSYGEGLDASDYMIASAVGRQGLIDKVVSVSDPGALSKEILNSTENLVITEHDCGADEGISLSTESHDIYDRYLAKPVTLRNGQVIDTNTVITPEIADQFRRSKVSKVVVRSTLKCQAEKGLCAKCHGHDEFGKDVEIGRNVGAVAAQSIGERVTQGSMRTFHCNHADSLVTVRKDKKVRLVSMKTLFEELQEPALVEEGEEVKQTSSGWEIWDLNGWTKLKAVRRHAPTAPMVLVSAGSLGTICQDNHPLSVWRDGTHQYLPPNQLVVGEDKLYRDTNIAHDSADAAPPVKSGYLAGMSVAAERLPPDFLDYSKEWLADFICGLADGDGTIKHHTDGPSQLIIDTTSFELVQQLMFICEKLDIVCGFHGVPVREVTCHQGYQVHVRLTQHAKTLLAESIKVASVATTSPKQSGPACGQCAVTNIRQELVYHHEHVYDATTESGTLFVGGLHSHNTGGVGAKGLIGMLDRLKQILRIQQIIPGSATLAETSGVVQQINKSPAGGWDVMINAERHYVPQDRGLAVKVGEKVKKGFPVSGGVINPHELLPLRGISAVQNYLSSELANLYADDGVRRRNAEIVIKALTRLARVEDSGEHDSVLRGDLVSVNKLMAWNKKHPKSKPIIFTPVLKGVKTAPLAMQEDWMARMQFQRLGETVIEAAMQGWKSDIHSEHPTPAVIYSAEFGKPPKDKPWAY